MELITGGRADNSASTTFRHAHPDEVPDSIDEWLEQFNTFSLYQILPELIDLWGLNVQKKVQSRKNFAGVSGK